MQLLYTIRAHSAEVDDIDVSPRGDKVCWLRILLQLRRPNVISLSNMSIFQNVNLEMTLLGNFRKRLGQVLYRRYFESVFIVSLVSVYIYIRHSGFKFTNDLYENFVQRYVQKY